MGDDPVDIHGRRSQLVSSHVKHSSSTLLHRLTDRFTSSEIPILVKMSSLKRTRMSALVEGLPKSSLFTNK